MTTDTQWAQDLYAQLKPGARRAARDYVLSHTPHEIQEEMVAAFEADVQGAMDEIAPPTVIDAPLIYQEGVTLKSTLGNWYGSPNSRTYQWKVAGVNVGTNAATYNRVAGDVGKTATCTMTATNVAGTSAPVVSNTITVV
jgi:hypothetical protein